MQASFFDLEDHPQLAALEILTSVLQVTEQALLAAHPGLAAGEGPDAAADPEDWIADAILLQSHILQQTLRRYRTAVDERDYPSRGPPPSDSF
jgi:hypothetical protein